MRGQPRPRTTTTPASSEGGEEAAGGCEHARHHNRSQVEDTSQHPRDAVLVVARRHVVGGRGARVGCASAIGVRRAGPREHRQVVGHVAEGDHVRGVDAEVGAEQRQRGGLGDARRR